MESQDSPDSPVSNTDKGGIDTAKHDYIADTLNANGKPLAMSCRNCGAQKTMKKNTDDETAEVVPDDECDDGNCPGTVYVRQMNSAYQK